MNHITLSSFGFIALFVFNLAPDLSDLYIYNRHLTNLEQLEFNFLTKVHENVSHYEPTENDTFVFTFISNQELVF